MLPVVSSTISICAFGHSLAKRVRTAGQEIRRDGGNRGQGEPARIRRVGDAGARVLGEAQDLIGVALEQPAGLGQPHAPAQALEQRLAQLAFELGDLLAERRLRHVTGLGGARHVAVLGHLGEVTKLMHLHGRSAWWLKG